MQNRMFSKKVIISVQVISMGTKYLQMYRIGRKFGFAAAGNFPSRNSFALSDEEPLDQNARNYEKA